MDRKGNLVLSIDQEDFQHIIGVPYNGLIKTRLYKKITYKGLDTTYERVKQYMGYVNLKGEIAIDDTNIRHVENFSDNRAFIREEGSKYSMIDRKGRKIKEKEYTRILEPGFVKGKAFVQVDWKWGLIDTNGIFIIKPHLVEIYPMETNYEYFFYTKRDSSTGYNDLSGVSSIDGNILIPPIMQYYDRRGFKNGLLSCSINDKLCYINLQGKVVWQDPEKKAPELSNMNIDYMNRAYFYAYSRANKKGWGFASSRNRPKYIKKSQNFLPNKLNLVVRPDIKDIYDDHYNGITVFIANTTHRKYYFNAQDSRLYMKVQALDAKGNWRDIEYIPNSWCRYSYHSMFLAPHKYWKFCSPRYEGDIKTRLRIELTYIDPNDLHKERKDRKEIILYSNEFEGSVNPGQFWRTRDYTPNGIMDPYDE